MPDAVNIADPRAEFSPVKASPCKTELVSLLLERYGCIIAFFCGHVLMAVVVAILGIISCDETMLTLIRPCSLLRPSSVIGGIRFLSRFCS
jgi:hypothetical protein